MQAFDELLTGPLAEFVRLSGEIGGDVKTQVCIMLNSIRSTQLYWHNLTDPKMMSNC